MGTTKQEEKIRYRIAVYITGAQTQYFYAWGELQRDHMLKAAIKALTDNEPGYAGLVPKQVIIEKRLRILSGKKSSWETMQAIQYKDLPADQLEWKKRKARLADARRDVAEAEAALEKPPLGLTPRKIWEENRLTDIAQAMERYHLANKPIPDEWHEELHELTQRAELCPTCRQARAVCVAIWNFGNRSLHKPSEPGAEHVVRFRTARITYDNQTLDAILDATPIEGAKPPVLDNLDMIDALIARAQERGLNVEFSNDERTINLGTAIVARNDLGQDIR